MTNDGTKKYIETAYSNAVAACVIYMNLLVMWLLSGVFEVMPLDSPWNAAVMLPTVVFLAVRAILARKKRNGGGE